MNFNQEVNFDFLSKGIDQGTARILYYRYKGYLISAAIIFICLLLFLFLIIPQIQTVLSLRSQEEQYRQKITILKENIAFLNRLDDASLNSQTQLVSIALPPEKDFVSILYALSTAAENASVSLSDFAFAIGEMSSSAIPAGTRPSIEIEVGIRGDTAGIKRFLSTLSSLIPVSEVERIEGSANSSTIGINFYYRPLPPITFKDDARISAQSAKEQELLKTLATWQPDTGLTVVGDKISSSVATKSGDQRLGPF